MGTNTGTIMTLANSIIGVSVLAMPFCFKQCGIILSIIMLIASSLLSRLACHFLLKCAVMARRRTFEFLAFHTFGRTGKFAVELFIIGFLMGTCIAFFVVMGDLGPAIVAKIFGASNTEALRPSVLIGLAVFVVLPLGMLKNVDSLSSVSMATIGFYICLVFKVIGESLPHLVAGDWYQHVHLWRPAGILQCIPIFSMALFCQTQLFEIYESMNNASLDRMNFVIRAACNICTGVYICVGFFGYIAFCTQQFSGNVLMSFTPSIGSEIIKLGFVLSVAVSFPLAIFPCRASLYSLLFRRITVPHHEGVGTHIPEARFKCLTVVIISVALIIGLLIPNIELVLGLVGSTIGVLICVMFPAAAFICMTSKSSNDRLLAQILLFVGALILVLGTYATLDSATEPEGSSNIPLNDLPSLDRGLKDHHDLHNIKLDNILANIPPKLEPKKDNVQPVKKERTEISNLGVKLPAVLQQDKGVDIPLLPNADKRQEPPVPVEPAGDVVQIPSNPSVVKENKVDDPVKKPGDIQVMNNPQEKELKPEADSKVDSRNGAEQIHRDAIIKEDEELAEAEKSGGNLGESKNEEILRKLEKHEEQQKKILQKQQEILDAIQEHQERDLLLQQKESVLRNENSNISQLSEKKIPLVEVSENKLPVAKVIPIQTEVHKIPLAVGNNVEPKGQINHIENKNSLLNEDKIRLSEEVEQKPGQEIVPALDNVEKDPPIPQKKQDLLQQIANGELKKQVVNVPVNNIVVEKRPDQGVGGDLRPRETKVKNIPEIKESFRISDPTLSEKAAKPEAPAPLLLKRLNQPIALQMTNKKQPVKELEEKPQDSMKEINAMRREILQESVITTPTEATLEAEGGGGNKILVKKEDGLKTKQSDLHEREKRDVEDADAPGAPANPIDSAANKSLDAATVTNVALEDQNCQRADREKANDGPSELLPMVVNLTENDSTKQILKTSVNETEGTFERVVNHVPNLDGTKKLNQNASSFSEQNEEPNEQQLLKGGIYVANVGKEIIKSSEHLSDPDLKANNNNDDMSVLKKGILSPDTKPMKRDLKSVQEERASDDEREG